MPEEVVRVRLDGAQVRQIQQARQSAQRLEGELRRSERGGRGGVGFGSGVLDRLTRIESLANRVLSIGAAVDRTAARFERFLALSGLESGTIRRARQEFEGVSGGLRGASTAAPVAVGLVQPLVGLAKLGRLGTLTGQAGPLAAATVVLGGAALGTYLGSEAPEKRIEGERNRLAVENEQARADAAIRKIVQEESAKGYAARAVASALGQFEAGMRRARRGAVR